jgi:hypothetical protein
MATQTSNTTTETYTSKHGDITKLNATNYHIWVPSVRYNLNAIRAWNIVAGEEEPPVVPANIANANITLCKYHEDKQNAYEARHNSAAAVIYQSCSPMIQPIVRGMTDPRLMWQTLKEHLDKTTNENGSLLLRQQLLKESYDGKSSITEYISRIYAYRDQLAASEQPLTNRELARHILGGLPESWETIRTLISN